MYVYILSLNLLPIYNFVDSIHCSFPILDNYMYALFYIIVLYCLFSLLSADLPCLTFKLTPAPLQKAVDK